MSLAPEQTLLHYRVVEKLGAGGMGEVWKAIDTTLDRAVAIKVLPEAFATDRERLARFEQEARLLASLSHPNIAAVYSVHEHEGQRFLAMELVEGQDLGQLLARTGRLPLEDALKIALQIAAALEAAHDSGVIHRDLKPANVQVTPAGKVKVLDFGLAKALAAAGADSSLSPTMTSARTLAGMILGTAGYMSPEQARGREVDRRADIWAFGCVLYEMLTGRRTFEGETVSDTLASVLKVDPAWDALPADTPPAVQRVLRRCLTRDLERRLSHVSGARIPLQEALEGGVEPETRAVATAMPAAPVWRRALPWALVAILAVISVVAMWSGNRPRVEPRELLALSATFPDGYAVPTDQMGVLDISPDGRNLALVLQNRETRRKQLFLRRMDRASMGPLDGTEGAATPAFSPDGAWIAFFAEGKLKKVAVDGGKPITLAGVDGDNRGMSWGADDRIVFASHYDRSLAHASAGGGEPQPLTTLDTARAERTHRWPQALPAHDAVLFTVGTFDSPENYDDSRIDVLRLSTGERRTVLEGASMARYVETGHLLFSREGFLFGVPFDIDRLEVRGNPVPLIEDVTGARSSGVVHAALSERGLLAYVAGAAKSRQSRLVWKHRDGRTEPVTGQIGGYVNPRLSRDRRQVAVEVEGGSTFDLWTLDVARGTMTRLTFEGDNTRPTWSPDGRRIAFSSVRDGLLSAWVKSADGGGKEELLFTPTPESKWVATTPSSWTPDGRFVLMEFANLNNANLLALDVESREPRVLLESPAAETRPEISPDGRWLAYVSSESGRPEIHVRPFPEGGGKWQLSDQGGVGARWSPDGRQLYYRNENSLYSVRIEAGASGFTADRPQLVFDGIPAASLDGDYDVLDAERFLLVEPVSDEKTARSVSVVVNWLDELRRRVPTP